MVGTKLIRNSVTHLISSLSFCLRTKTYDASNPIAELTSKQQYISKSNQNNCLFLFRKAKKRNKIHEN